MGASLAAGSLRLAICWHVFFCRAHTGDSHTHTTTQLAFGERSALHCIAHANRGFFAFCARSFHPDSKEWQARRQGNKYYRTHSACVLSIATVCYFATVSRGCELVA
jgi:hypothetical protein